MTTYRAGEIVLVAFPYADSARVKRRPALVVIASGDADVVLALVTTRGHRTEYDVAIVEWQKAGLAAPSMVRLDKLATIEQRLVERRLGVLPSEDRDRIASVLRRTFGRWR